MTRGRPKSFDEDQVLTRAMNVFWRQGYEATSLDDLTAHMGIPRQSVYRSFTDKHTLFLKALESYDRRVIAKVLETLSGSGLAITKLENLFSLWRKAAKSPDRLGCMMVNTQTQFVSDADQVEKLVKKSHRRFLSALEKTIVQAQQEGDVSSKINAKQSARLIFATSNGLMAMSRARVSNVFLDDVIDSLFVHLGIQ